MILELKILASPHRNFSPDKQKSCRINVMPAHRAVEAVVSRKTGHKFPVSLVAIYWYQLLDISKLSGHSESWKPSWQRKLFLYSKGYICNRVLTRSPDIADNMLIRAQQIEPCLHKQGTFPLLQKLLKTLEKSVKASFSYSWRICVTFKQVTQRQRTQNSADLSLWKLGLDTLAFWHIRSRSLCTILWWQDVQVLFSTKRQALEITASCRTHT